MDNYIYLFTLFFIFFIIFYSDFTQKKRISQIVRIRRKKRRKEVNKMVDIINKYLNSNVVVKTIESAYIGKLVRIEENWIVIFEGAKKGENSINLDYVTSIRPYKGKVR